MSPTPGPAYAAEHWRAANGRDSVTSSGTTTRPNHRPHADERTRPHIDAESTTRRTPRLMFSRMTHIPALHMPVSRLRQALEQPYLLTRLLVPVHAVK